MACSWADGPERCRYGGLLITPRPLAQAWASLLPQLLFALRMKWKALWWLVDLVTQSVNARLEWLVHFFFFTQMQLWVAQTLKLELLQLRNIKYHILQHWDTWPYPRAKGIFHVAVYLTLSELNSDGWLHGNRSTAELPEHIQATLRHPSLCVISRWVLLEVCVCICNTVLSADGYPVTLVRYGLNIQDEDCGISWAASPARCSVNC